MGDRTPEKVQPMLAVTGPLPDDVDRWALELKWDGVRAIVHVTGGKVEAAGRSGIDATDRYPELQALGDLLPDQTAVLDGEVVAFDEHGRPSFERLQRRMHTAEPDIRLTRQVPVHFIAFDLLYLDGHLLYDVPYTERRAALDGLELAAGPIEAPPYLPGSEIDQVGELLDFTREQGLEGIVAKRLDSPYRPGRRVDFWRKIKNFHTRDVVICGWKPGKGRRAGGIGSLLLGVNGDEGLHFVGHVGTGFTDSALDELYRRLAPLRRPTNPYEGPVPREFAKDAQWVEPRLVGEVAYTLWTRDGRLRTPSWRGIRDEIPPEEVTF
jgi:bifunctional non-homologous end joining protein LigD